MALFFAACLECAGLHPVLALGRQEVACGVWLYDNCFADAAGDDVSLLQKYISDGINNVSMFDAADLFAGKSVNYTASEKHFAQKLERGCYDTVVDVRRCRLGRILPLPLKVKGVSGPELLGEEDTDLSAAPADLSAARKLSLDGKIAKNKQWERRLLDLSLKNALLHFRPEKNALHIAAPDADRLREALAEGKPYALAARTADMLALPEDAYFAAPRQAVGAERAFRIGAEKTAACTPFPTPPASTRCCAPCCARAKTAEEEDGRERALPRPRLFALVRV